MTGPVSPFLQGAFTPLYGERTVHHLTVQGALPPELDGLFTQIGGNPVAPPRRRGREDYSWFSQDGMVCGVRLRGGRADWFRNRWIRSRQVCRTLGVPRPPGPRRFVTDIVNTNVVCHGGLLLALVESGCLPARLSGTLETVEYTDLGGALPRGFSAHPKTDPVSGELVAVAYSPLRTSADYLVIDRDGTLSKAERIPLGGRPMMHDIALTQRYVVLFDLPVRFDLVRAARGTFPFRWNPRHQARIGLLHRAGRGCDVRWFPIEPCFVFHTVNAVDEDGGVRVHALRYATMFDRTSQDPFAYGGGRLWEWRVDPRSGRVTERQLDDRHQELPRIDPRRIGRPFRHYYGLSGVDRGLATYEPESLLKYDLVEERVEERRLPGGSVPTEPVFVPRPGSGGVEDDGWILHFVIDPLHHASDLVVLDARDITGPPVATVRLPVRVPFGFHSSWIPGPDLDAVRIGLRRRR